MNIATWFSGNKPAISPFAAMPFWAAVFLKFRMLRKIHALPTTHW